MASHVLGAIKEALGLGEPEVEQKPLENIPGIEIPGISPLGDKCKCEIPSMNIKGLYDEDQEYIKNIDEYTFKGLSAHKADGEAMFAKGYNRVQYEKQYIDKAVKRLQAAYTTVADSRRLLEHAQQRAAWVHYSKCRPFKKKFGMFLPCEETFRETMQVYRDLHQDPTCVVGGSISLKPAGVAPSDGGAGESGALLALAATPRRELLPPRSHRGKVTSRSDADFL
mmetsp:Transcript_610/g.491  ORF Transcript_610/g.491 Transcript_610/m.491 type:complete len:225 (+) Transcript_610:210-884(+)